MELVKDAEVIYNTQVAANYFRIGLSFKTPEVKPGQFVMIKVTGALDPLLRRPLGIYNVLGGKGAFKGDRIELLYKVVGKGTYILSTKSKGERVGVLGPLGNGFPVLRGSRYKKVILAAGGMGIVPLYLLSKKLPGSLMLFGCRGGAEAGLAKDFNGDILISTEDGSVGRRGLVTELLKEEITPDSVVYACGPPLMLKSAASIADRAGARCFVSLEKSMACGIGVCLGCAVKTKAHEPEEAENKIYKMVCSDGPVFDSRVIDWEAF